MKIIQIALGIILAISSIAAFISMIETSKGAELGGAFIGFIIFLAISGLLIKNGIEKDKK